MGKKMEVTVYHWGRYGDYYREVFWFAVKEYSKGFRV